MRYLLDTHVVLALVNDAADTLPGQMYALLNGTGSSFVASVATIWEIAIKSRLRKLPLKNPLETLADQLASIDIEVVEVSATHALAEVTPQPPTRDPFDQLLLAVAQVEQIALVTLDRALRDHPLVWQPGSA